MLTYKKMIIESNLYSMHQESSQLPSGACNLQKHMLSYTLRDTSQNPISPAMAPQLVVSKLHRKESSSGERPAMTFPPSREWEKGSEINKRLGQNLHSRGHRKLWNQPVERQPEKMCKGRNSTTEWMERSENPVLDALYFYSGS